MGNLPANRLALTWIICSDSRFAAEMVCRLNLYLKVTRGDVRFHSTVNCIAVPYLRRVERWVRFNVRVAVLSISEYILDGHLRLCSYTVTHRPVNVVSSVCVL